MRIWILTYGATALAFLACDAVWLGLMGSRLYRPRLGALMREDFAVAPALVFYALYVAGMVVFAIAPVPADAAWTSAFVRGALLGLMAYATYDLTNQATLRGWPWAITVADLCWGTFVTGVAASVGFIVLRALR